MGGASSDCVDLMLERLVELRLRGSEGVRCVLCDGGMWYLWGVREDGREGGQTCDLEAEPCKRLCTELVCIQQEKTLCYDVQLSKGLTLLLRERRLPLPSRLYVSRSCL